MKFKRFKIITIPHTNRPMVKDELMIYNGINVGFNNGYSHRTYKHNIDYFLGVYVLSNEDVKIGDSVFNSDDIEIIFINDEEDLKAFGHYKKIIISNDTEVDNTLKFHYAFINSLLIHLNNNEMLTYVDVEIVETFEDDEIGYKIKRNITNVAEVSLPKTQFEITDVNDLIYKFAKDNGLFNDEFDKSRIDYWLGKNR